MAFPSTAVLDSFNRADAALNTGDWATLALTGTAANIVSNQAASTAAGIRGSYWRTTRFDLTAGVEAYGTFAVKPTSTNSVYLMAVLDGSDATPDGYALNVHTGDVRIERFTAGIPTVLRTVTVTWNAGDVLGLLVQGGVVSAYRNGVLLDSVSDSTHGGACHIVLALQSTTPRVDDFGGGTPRTSTTTVAIGTAPETDTARPLAASKAHALGPASETDGAQPLGARKVLALRTVVSTEEARPLPARKITTTATASETSTARPFAASKIRSLATATETDTARPLTVFVQLQATDLPTSVTLAPHVVTATAQARVTTVLLEARRTTSALEGASREVTLDG